MWEVMKAQASRWSKMRRLLLCRDTSDDINVPRYVCMYTFYFRRGYTSYHWATYERGYNRNFFLSFFFPKVIHRSISVSSTYLYRFQFDSSVSLSNQIRQIRNDINAYTFLSLKNFYFEFPSGIPKFVHLECGGREFTRSFTISVGRWLHERSETSRLKVNEHLPTFPRKCSVDDARIGPWMVVSVIHVHDNRKLTRESSTRKELRWWRSDPVCCVCIYICVY